MRNRKIHRGRCAVLVAAAAGFAGAPTVGLAQVLFTDNFNADSTARYNIYSYDAALTPAVVAPSVAGDTAISPAFKYTDYKFRDTATDEETIRHGFIPIAPNTPAGATEGFGLRLDVNNVGSTSSTSGGGQSVINLLPKLTEFTGGNAPSGNYKVTVDVWMNYNGGFEGGGGSTEFMTLGLNQQGPANGLAGVVVADPAVQQKGQAIAIDGERGNGADYRLYSSDSRLSNTLDSSTGYVASPDALGNSGGNGENPFFKNGLFPAITSATPDGFETFGAPGKRWVTLEAKYVDGVAYYSLDAHRGGGMQLIAARTDLTSTSGPFALGYADTIQGRAATETSTVPVPPGSPPGTLPDTITDVDANFVVYDNLVVEQLAATAKPTWTAASGTWTEGAKWSGATPNAADAFAVFGASAAGATVTIPSAGITTREIDFNNSGMTIGGTGPLTIDSPGTTGGVMGTFNVQQGNHVISAPVTVNKNVLFHAEAGSSLTFTQPLSDSTFQFTKSGDGTVTVRSGRNGGLIILGGTLSLAPGSGTMSTASLLIVGPILGVGQRGSIDINDNKFIVDYTGTVGSASSNIRTTIQGAYTNGTWAGKGLLSSAAVTDPNKIKGIGYWEAKTLLALPDGGTATWFGQTVDDTSILIMSTYLGDLNADGRINADDFALLDRSFAKKTFATGTAARWFDGDLNYDGVVTAADYAIIDKSYGILGGGLSPDFLAMREAEFGPEYVSGLLASVPEPTSLLAACGLALPLLRRRTR